MKKFLIILLFIILFILYAGTLTVGSGQYAISSSVFSQNKVKVYNSGIYFNLPIINKVEYLYSGERTSPIQVELKTGDTQSQTFIITLLVNWAIIDPIVYVEQSNKEQFKQAILGIINDTFKNKDLTSLNSNLYFIESSFLIQNLGIKVNNIILNNITKQSESNLATLPQTQESSFISLNQLMSLESSFVRAHQIYTDTLQKQHKLYQKALDESTNPEFYTYFRQLELGLTNKESN